MYRYCLVDLRNVQAAQPDGLCQVRLIPPPYTKDAAKAAWQAAVTAGADPQYLRFIKVKVYDRPN